MVKFEMTKPVFSSVVSIYLILAFVFLIFLFLAITFISAGNYKMVIDNNQMTIKSVFYNTKISLSDIEKSNIKVININNENTQIQIRTNGIGLPGMQIGWFSGNGIKYKLYITDRNEVVSIPTKKGYTILFSSKHATEIVNELKRNADSI